MRSISGHAFAGMKHGPRPPAEIFSIEIAFFLIVAALCLLIYFKTRNIYKLTNHKGIYFFRNIFLFFFLAYLFRLLFIFVFMSRELFSSILPMQFRFYSMVFVTYFSVMAGFSMFMSVHHRYFKWKENIIDIVMHMIAVVISTIVFVTRSHLTMTIILSVFFLVSVIVVFVQSPKHKLYTKNRAAYALLFVFWITSIITAPKNLLSPTLKIALYGLSIVIFVSIYYRLQKRFSNAKKR